MAGFCGLSDYMLPPSLLQYCCLPSLASRSTGGGDGSRMLFSPVAALLGESSALTPQALGCLEVMVGRCSRPAVTPWLPHLLKTAIQYLTYDPNYDVNMEDDDEDMDEDEEE